ncbi:MAG: ABC transporter permease, partial [Planctomycetota bacterium]
ANAMIAMNRRAKTEDTDEGVIAADFLNGLGGFTVVPRARAGLWARLARTTREHLVLTFVPLAFGSLVAVPLGIAAGLLPRLGQVVLAVAGIGQTIPSLALLALFVPKLGIGAPPALLALFVYALLPIVRATQTGVAGVPRSLIESAEAIGLGWYARVAWVRVPLAMSAILSGIKTSAVITVGFATLGAFVGAGGYGEPILTGIRRQDVGTILEGAIPAACMAIAVQVLFEILDRIVVPRGLR